MSIITKILNWFRGTSNTTAVEVPYKMEAPTLEEAVLPNTHTFPFPTSVGSVPVEGAGVVEVAKPKPAAMTAKPKAPAKPKAVKAPAKPKAVKATAKPKPVAKPKAPAKPKAVSATSKKA